MTYITYKTSVGAALQRHRSLR